MNLTKTIPLDLAARGAAIQIGEAAVAGDSGSRSLSFELLQDGSPWLVPDGVRAGLEFRTEHGSEGAYDTMPDGSDAAQISGNRVTVRLHDAVMARAGTVWLALVLRDQALERLSTFPLMMQVSRGLGDARQMPVQYYQVRNLSEVNAALAELSERVGAVDTEANQQAAREARQAAEAAREYAAAVDTEQIRDAIRAKGDDVYLQDGRLYLVSDGRTIGAGVELPEGGSGLAFDSGYVDGENLLHLTLNGEDIEGFTPFALPAGGGGGDTGSRLTVAMSTAASLVAAESAGTVELAFRFESVDKTTGVATGSGTMTLAVNGAVKRTAEILQGDCTLNIRPYLSAGSNAVVLTVTDAYGASAVRRISVTLETLALSWSLGATAKTESSLTLTLTPVGNYTKTIRLAVDGELLESWEVNTSGRQNTKTIPEQSHGGHRITAWATMEVAGTTMTSDVLECAAAWVTDDVLPAIACVDVPEEVDQFSTVRLVHRVIDPQNNPAGVQYLINDVLFRETEVDQSEQVWTCRLSEAGETKLSILCGGVRHDEIISVAAIGESVREVTDGLDLKIDPAVMAELADWESGGYSFALSEGFDQVNGGLCSDADGVRCIRITAGDRLTLNYPLFGGDARKNGLSAKIIYAVRNSSAKHCTAISCMNGGIGLEVQANNVYLSGNQTRCKLSTCEDERTELDLTIHPDSGDGIIQLWEACSTFSYMKYASDESFSHTSQPGITFGCDEADVYLYLFRAYPGRALTDEELKANFVADGVDTEAILTRQSRNDIYDSTGAIDIEKCASRNPDCHHIVISAERMTEGKSDEVKGTIRHIYRSGGPEHQFTAQVSMFVQGTSSVEHALTAGPNINFYFPGGIVLDDGTVVADGYAMNGRDKSIPVLELTYKKNIASQDHIINAMSAEHYNTYQPSIRQARVEDPRVRDCLDSTMCAVYFQNTGESAVQVGPDLVPPGATVFFGLGNLCSNKDSVAAFGYHPIVIEVRNNTEPQVRFKSQDLTGDNWGNNYEFRYLDTAQFTEDEAKALWQKVQTFLYETDCTAATDAMLAKTVTINGVSFVRDSTEYRKARWDAESPVIFDKKTLTFHHNITLFLLLRDNRAKNMFWAWDPIAQKWGLWFNWDNDTGLCRNNDGYVDIEPGWLDFDTIGTGDVFNGADNVLFVNLRTWDFDLLKADYLERESAHCWDIDRLYAYAMESQERICEALWIEDAQHNAIRTMRSLGTTAYLERATGRLRLHIRKALTFQKVLVDSYYCSTDAVGQRASFRGYTPSEWAGVAPSGRISVVTYTRMYINVLAGNTSFRVLAEEGIPVELDISASLNNTEIYFYQAPWYQSLGDLSGLYLGQFEASSLRRVRELRIGSENTAYYNTNFTQASFDNCLKLEKLNLGGLKNATRSFDLSPNLYLKEICTTGSGITGLSFAKKGRLETARLNALKSLSMDSLHRLQSFSMPDYAALTTLSVASCPAVDTQAMVQQANALERVRLTDVDWSLENADILIRLSGCAGRDDDGHDTASAVVTGKVHVAVITQAQIDAVTAAFPELELSYDEIVASVTVTFCNEDGTELNTQVIRSGGTAVNPITAGLIDTPAKASDVEYHYSFTGWDKALGPITTDTVITAVYTAADRFYTVTHWADAAESIPLQTKKIIAHGRAEYTGSDPEGEGLWIGWDADTTDVVSNMDVHAVFIEPKLPDSVPQEYDYLYSNDPDAVCKFTAAEFYGILYYGLEREYFALGDRIKLNCSTDGFTDQEIVLELRSYRHFESAEREGFAGPYFGMVGGMNAGHCMNANHATNVGGWPASEMAAFLQETVYPGLPKAIRAMIEKIRVLSSAGNTTADIVSMDCWLTLESEAEVGINSSAVPYVNEIAAGADEVTFVCYTDNDSRIKKQYNGTGTAVTYWTRSPQSTSAQNWHDVANFGVGTASMPHNARAVSFGFCLRTGGAA